MKIIKNISNIILIIIAIILTLMLVEKILYKDKVPNIFGIKSFIVLSGSMEPNLKKGDLVFARKSEDIELNDIVVFKINDNYITHRIVESYIDENNDTKYITKGDNNNTVDDDPITKDDIEGKYLFKIPAAGKFILFLKEKKYVLIFIILIIICLNYLVYRKGLDNEKSN